MLTIKATYNYTHLMWSQNLEVQRLVLQNIEKLAAFTELKQHSCLLSICVKLQVSMDNCALQYK